MKTQRARVHRMIPGRFRYAGSDDMLRLLGVKRLPVEGMEGRFIAGVWVYVKPLPVGKPGQRQSLRVMAVCGCGRHLAVGRLHQHRCNAVDVALCPRCGADERTGCYCAMEKV